MDDMHAPPRIRGGVALRLGVLVLGLFVFAAGIVALLESGLGLSPWDVLHQGIARHTPLTFGEANIAVSAVVVVAAWLLGATIGIGTIANALLVGGFVQLLTAPSAVDALSSQPLPVRVGLLAAGLPLMGAGTALYVSAGLGAGPRDSLMLVGARRTRFRIGAVRATLEMLALGAGVVSGGTIGLGTLAFAIAIGPSVELAFWMLGRTPLVERKRTQPARTPGRNLPHDQHQQGGLRTYA
jgi:uncharacterized protein